MLIVVVGLQFEARIAAGEGMHVISRCDSPTLAAVIARAVVKDSAGLVSFGVAGGLSPSLSPGSCVVASEIFSGTSRLMTDRSWSQSLLHAIPNAIYGGIVGVPTPIAYPEAKRALYADCGAVAVDMESHVVASVAAANDLPFAAIRVITDPADRAVPQVALAAMRPNGTVSIAAMIRSIMKHPNELGALMQTTRDVVAARAALRRARQALG